MDHVNAAIISSLTPLVGLVFFAEHLAASELIAVELRFALDCCYSLASAIVAEICFKNPFCLLLLCWIWLFYLFLLVGKNLGHLLLKLSILELQYANLLFLVVCNLD